jgi:hypothetical protein
MISYPYEEIIEFIASGPSQQMVAAYQPSDQLKMALESLIAKEKSSELTAEEKAMLDDYMRLEHIMRLAKARARQQLAHA